MSLKATGYGLVGIAAIVFAYVALHLSRFFVLLLQSVLTYQAFGGRGASGSSCGVSRWWPVYG